MSFCTGERIYDRVRLRKMVMALGFGTVGGGSVFGRIIVEVGACRCR